MSETIEKTAETDPRDRVKARFYVSKFTNPSGAVVYRVQGLHRDGSRIRLNFHTRGEADCKSVELNLQHIGSEQTAIPRVTSLSAEQLRHCETAMAKLEDPADIGRAVALWIRERAKQTEKPAPRLDEAFGAFVKWIGSTPDLRPRSKLTLKARVEGFVNSTANVNLATVTPEMVHEFLAGRKVSRTTQINLRRGLSRFFSWCMEMPRKWISLNPCAQVKLKPDQSSTGPEILPVQDIARLMAEAERFLGGALVPYLAVCTFGALRPTEAERLTWSAINLQDGELRLEAHLTKTKQPRTVNLCATAREWLESCKGKPFRILNHRRNLDTLKRRAGFSGRVDPEQDGDLKPWPQDVLRHTGISHFFRSTGSYGLTCEMAGNSEAIVKKFYQGRVSTADTQAFYSIKPSTNL
jgi:integrase